MDKLSRLAIKYNSDRHPGSKHSYTPYYDQLFNDRRETIKKVLEIGVGDGRGLRMWRDFFPNATIYGADNMPNRVFKENRIEVYYCDQSNEEELLALIKKIGTDLDFVVDDGSHKPEHQVFTCQTLIPLLNPNVIYVIEDVADRTIIEQLTEFNLEIPSLRPKKTRYDDRLIIVRHAMQKTIPSVSIFTGKVFLSTNPGEEYVDNGIRPKRGYLKRVSAMIRGNQVAEAIGAKLNPKTDYKNGACIYVKPEPGPDGNYKFEGKRQYLDVIDGGYYIPQLKDYPKVKAIVCSESDYFFSVTNGLADRTVLIPQHHCNYNRETRTRSEITTVGAIGNRTGLGYIPAELRQRLAERGVEFLELWQFFTRQDVVDFYKKIDIQIVWRPYMRKRPVSNPLKIINAASFGIPTIALDEPTFKETGNCYLGVQSLDEFLVQLDRLRTSPGLYRAYSELCRATAERYHIDNIAKLYLNL